MELFLLKLVGLFRPLASIEFAAAIFEVAGIGLFGLLGVAFLANSAMRKSLRVSAVDAVIVVFALWCLAIYVIYFEHAYIRDVAKLLIPMLGYIVVKNVVQNRSEYEALLRWMIIGFSIPTAMSAVLIIGGSGLDYVDYWTDALRYRGVYEGSHSLGHSMTLFLIVILLYDGFRRAFTAEDARKRTVLEMIVLGALAGTALYCLYKSQVRSAIVGLAVFTAIYFYFTNRKLFLIGAVGISVFAALTWEIWLPNLSPEYGMMQKGQFEMMDLGSGRPRFWMNDISLFASLPIDQKIAGAGLGSVGKEVSDGMLIGHSDWLTILTQTGLVGFALFSVLQVLLFMTILRMRGKERYAYLALFAAVNVMMMVSNSYAWRIQVSQLYYMLLAYIEVRQSQAMSSQGAVQVG